MLAPEGRMTVAMAGFYEYVRASFRYPCVRALETWARERGRGNFSSRPTMHDESSESAGR